MTLLSPRAVRLTLALPALAILVAGCSILDGGPEAARGPYAFTADVVPPESSMLVLPNELVEDRLAVRRRQAVNGWVTETVVLANDTAKPRENTLAIRARHGGTGWQRLFRGNAVQPMDAATLDARLRQEFAGASELSPMGQRRNRRGAYNFVTARYDDGVRCVFAWQVVNPTSAMVRDLGQYGMEYRVCDRERDPERLMDLYDQVAITPYL